MSRVVRRTSVAAVAVVASIGGWSASAGAAQPVVHACVGTTFATAAHAPGPLGVVIKEFAQAPDTAHPGLGDGIQMLQAGLVPDDVAVNTCND
jgi:hypothetical protein